MCKTKIAAISICTYCLESVEITAVYSHTFFWQNFVKAVKATYYLLCKLDKAVYFDEVFLSERQRENFSSGMKITKIYFYTFLAKRSWNRLNWKITFFVKTFRNIKMQFVFVFILQKFHVKQKCVQKWFMYSVWHLVSQICVKFSDSRFSASSGSNWVRPISNESLGCLVCCLRFSNL